MSEKRYYIKREGNHFKLSPQSQEEPLETPTSVQSNAPKRVKRSIWSMIGNFFSMFLSGLILIIGFLIATPFFLINLLINWIKLSIGFAIFWAIAYIVYDTIILNNMSLGVHPFNTTIVLTIMGLGFIASIFVTIAQIKE
ncbi:lactose transporter [Streptococcus pneumoniae]|jgi:hypothetical protein|uniref:lactose transporter n=1 Tax=Streptococcus chosunensis TaxID=2707003 RepID=UPI001ABF13FC|nr:lactose transporter [Streptococcus chosunense]MDS2238034.1 lactose transporter [Streptococcus pneumoniae]